MTVKVWPTVPPQSRSSRQADGAAILRLERLTRTFAVGDQFVRALDGVDLSIGAGEYISLMGPSGSGKSTLLNILGLLDRPTSGEYWLAGERTSTMSDDRLADTRQREIGFVFQFFHLIHRMTAVENVELPMMLAGVPLAERRARAHEVLAAHGADGAYRSSLQPAFRWRAATGCDRTRCRDAGQRSCWPMNPPAIWTVFPVAKS